MRKPGQSAYLQATAVGLLMNLALCAGSAATQPNIVVFLADDLGWQDTSVPFYYSNGLPVMTDLNRRFKTPNMERLASQGVKFTSAYAHCVCSPSRVSLMTGLNPARHRVTNWTLRKNTGTDGANATLTTPEWNVNGLSPDPSTPRAVCAPALPQLLRNAGYYTIHVGKAHFGALDTPAADPRQIGFNENIGGHAAGGPGSYLGEQNYSGRSRKAEPVWDVPGLGKYHGTDTFLTEALTIEAEAAVDRALETKAPFFLYLSHYAVHVPYAADQRFYESYRKAGLDNTEAMYAALVEGVDKSLGDIMAHLENKGVASNTVVLFMSDNGGLSAQGRTPPLHRHNAPLKSGKGSAYEGGIREPMIVRWPGVVKPGSVCHTPVIIEDFFPSILELAGAAASIPKVDGMSFVPLLKNPLPASERARRALFWHYPNVWGPTGPGIGPFSAIREGNWKLIYFHEGSRLELYNLAEDIGEQHDLAEAQMRRTQALAAKLSAWLLSARAQMPTIKSSGYTVPLPSIEVLDKR